MNKFVKYLLIIIGLNILLIILISALVFYNGNRSGEAIGSLLAGIVLTFLGLCVQIIVGLIYLGNKRKKEIGKALLLSAGIILLIGLSICSRS